MEHLIGNGTHLYKKTGHLVRTPMTVTLKPDDRAYYSVAGEYTSAGYPDRGWIMQGSVANNIQAGRDLFNAYYSPPSADQRWRRVTTSHDPETCWYQGAYATSAPASVQRTSVEAYAQLGGYRFTLPRIPDDLAVTNIKAKYKTTGAVVCYLSPALGSANNRLWSAESSAAVYMPLIISDDLYAPSVLQGTTYYQNGPNLAQISGTPRGSRDLWAFSDGRDGAIPSLNVPADVSFDLTAAMRGRAAQLGTFWTIPFIYFRNTTTTGSGYEPYYPADNAFYWAAVSVYGVSLEVSIGST